MKVDEKISNKLKEMILADKLDELQDYIYGIAKNKEERLALLKHSAIIAREAKEN